MKTKNIYDHLDKDFEQIDEKTIIEETGVNTENVKKIFNEKLSAQNSGSKKTSAKTKRRGKKRSILIAAAVAASLLVFGTVGAGAAGSFDSVFAENFAGDKVDGVYSGGNVNISSAEGYNTEFLGIAGDHHSVAAAVNITKSDGSAFVDSDKVKFTYILNMPYGIVGENDEKKYMDQLEKELLEHGTNPIEFAQNRDPRRSVTVEQSLWNRMTNGFKQQSDGFSMQYFLTSPDKIKCVMRYDDGNYDLVGQKMNFEGGLLFFYNVREVLGSCNVREGYDAECILAYGKEGFKYQSNNTALVDSIADSIQNAKKNLGENEYVVKYIDNDGTENKLFYYVADIKTEFIRMSGSCRLNYKPGEHTSFEVKENSFYPYADGVENYRDTGAAVDNYNGHPFSSVTANITSMDAGTFNASVKVECTGDTSPFDYMESKGAGNKWYVHLKYYINRNPFVITLENGSTVYGSLDLGSWKENSDGSIEFMLVYYTDTGWTSIAPEEITSVTFAGYKII